MATTRVKVSGWVDVDTNDPVEAEQIVNAVTISHFKGSQLNIEVDFEYLRAKDALR